MEELLVIALLCIVQGILRRHHLAVGIFHCHAYDAEEAALVKGLGGEFGGTAPMGQAESVLGQVQPGEGVEYLVIVIGLTAGGYAAQQRGRGGHGFAAHPFDEGKGVLRPFGILGHSQGTASDNWIAAGRQGISDISRYPGGVAQKV